MRSFGLLLLSLFVLGFPVKTIVETKTGREVKTQKKQIVIKWGNKTVEGNCGGSMATGVARVWLLSANGEAAREGSPCHGPLPRLFNHVQLYSRSLSSGEITSPVMVTKPSRPPHIGNHLEPSAHTLTRHRAPAFDLLSNNNSETNTV